MICRSWSMVCSSWSICCSSLVVCCSRGMVHIGMWCCCRSMNCNDLFLCRISMAMHRLWGGMGLCGYRGMVSTMLLVNRHHNCRRGTMLDRLVVELVTVAEGEVGQGEEEEGEEEGKDLWIDFF